MAITINGGTNAITGLAVGGLPDGSVDKDSLAADSVDGSKILDDAVAAEHVADDAVGVAQLSTTGTAGTGTFLRGDNSWQAAGGGKVAKVFAQATHATAINCNNVAWTDTGLAITVTPTSASNKLWLHFMVPIHCYAYGNPTNSLMSGGNFRITFNHSGISETQLWQSGTVDGSGNQTGHIGFGSGYRDSGTDKEPHMSTNAMFCYIHAPATTNAITYKVYGNSGTGANSQRIIAMHGNNTAIINVLEVEI